MCDCSDNVYIYTLLFSPDVRKQAAVSSNWPHAYNASRNSGRHFALPLHTQPGNLRVPPALPSKSIPPGPYLMYGWRWGMYIVMFH